MGATSRYDSKDHPHACGDKERYYFITNITRGSSPRVWGQVLPMTSHWLAIWIIPTRVGTSIILEKDTCALWDHPHACGDKNPQKQLCNGTQGSSPRVWGQVLMSLLRQRYVGIIPTRVGTSTSIVPAIMGAEDHPHACGDKQVKQQTLLNF